MNCPFCEAPLAPGTKFCPHCGTSLAGDPRPDGPGPSDHPPYGPPPYGPMPPPTSSLAIASLVSALIGWFVVPIVGALVAVVTGHMARAEIRSRRGQVSGDGLALTGLILGYAQLILAALILLAVLVFFGAVVTMVRQAQPQAVLNPPQAVTVAPASAPGDDVAARVVRIIGERMDVPADRVTPNTSLADDLMVDDLDRVEIVLALEEEFGVTIPDAEAETLQTVGQAIELIESKQSARDAGMSPRDGPSGDAPAP